jgi:hypothetical protein
MAHASITDLEARWRPLSPEERATASTLLEDAADQINAEFPALDGLISAGNIAKLRVTVRVECAMVKRAMAVADDAFGVASTQETTGPFSRSYNYTNPMGDLYLTKAERRLLGGPRQTAFAIDTAPDEACYIAPVDFAPNPTWGILPEVP